MNQKKQPNQAQLPYNAEVTKAYHKVLKFAKQMISTLPAYEARCTLELNEKHAFSELKIHQFVSPMLYLSLEVGEQDSYYIHFGYEQFDSESRLADFSSKFVRAIYRLTSRQATTIDIEDCVHTNNLITTCSELYEVIEDSAYNKHVFKEIPYRPKNVKRKLMRAVG
ncbi:hypothetical protein DYU05_20585 [Mucilaginibacter terrenus]|uniref:Uncharacterized protein n=1 Tax=Mucilaginibacter terrenus TaxID=2482727 RepID=A0A3E2NJH7_9SPHI|nr:hypothetical protein [Mucilaginibacter terrenus]RFZ81157.1 hypothetical protein DYU05_20585 [Mucilaginibacter terrenus]